MPHSSHEGKHLKRLMNHFRPREVFFERHFLTEKPRRLHRFRVILGEAALLLCLRWPSDQPFDALGDRRVRGEQVSEAGPRDERGNDEQVRGGSSRA